MSDEVLIDAENLGKKFCRSLKRSLWYGMQDIAKDLSPFNSPKASNSHQAQSTKHKEQSTKHQEPGTTPNQQPETTSQFQNLGISTFQDFLPPALRAEEFWALQNVSFQLRRGECLGLIGHNGAGKSTLLKILNGLIRPDTGRLVTRGRIGALIELSAGFNPVLTGRENIYNRGAVLGFSREEIAKKFDAIVDFAEIGDFIDMPVQHYSSGMLVRLGFAVSTQMEPDILILDEVLAVGDVEFRTKCINRIAEIIQSSACIFVSHSMPNIVRMCNSALVLESGKSIYQGMNLSRALDAYLGTKPALESPASTTGDVEVSRIEISKNGEVQNSRKEVKISWGEKIKITCEIDFHHGTIDASIQFVLWTQELIPLMAFLGPDLRGYPFRSSESGRTRIELDSGELKLNGGRYSLTIYVTSRDLNTHLWRQDNIASITVTSQTESGALSVVPGTWSSIPI